MKKWKIVSTKVEGRCPSGQFVAPDGTVELVYQFSSFYMARHQECSLYKYDAEDKDQTGEHLLSEYFSYIRRLLNYFNNVPGNESFALGARFEEIHDDDNHFYLKELKDKYLSQVQRKGK